MKTGNRVICPECGERGELRLYRPGQGAYVRHGYDLAANPYVAHVLGCPLDNDQADLFRATQPQDTKGR